jgi:DNA-binding NarL/FixJ family response regulator
VQGHDPVTPFRVLVVDDFEPWRRFVCSTLQRKPELHVVCEVSDGVEAVQKAQELQPDLILLDIGLPKLNGMQAARQIQKLVPESRILFLSQESSADVVHQAISLGAAGYVVKTSAASELLLAVEAVLRGRRFISASLRNCEIIDYPAPASPWRHEVCFCLDDACLLDTFTRVVADALNSGNAAIVLATASHRESLLERLNKQGLNMGHAIQEGTYIALDAAESLVAMMVDGLPDRVRFFRGISSFIESANKAAKTNCPRVVVCGEGVALLQAEGKSDAANRLGQLCEELTKACDVDVLCAYPFGGIRTMEA